MKILESTKTVLKWTPFAALAGCSNRNFSHGMGGGMGYDGFMGMYGYGGLFMWVIIILVVGLIIYVIMQQTGRSRGPVPPAHETALDILKKRYARGDIDRETYERLKRDIEL